MTDASTPEAATEQPAESQQQEKQQRQEEPKPQTFTQADLDRLVSKARAEERRKASEKFGDYDTVKSERASLEERLAAVEQARAEEAAKALKADVASRYGIAPEDRDMFLTASDPDVLESQAKRLAERDEALQKRNSIAPNEGANLPAGAVGSDEAFAAAIAQALGRAQ